MDKNSTILVIGHDDIIENSLFEYFSQQGYAKVLSSTKQGIDLIDQKKVFSFFDEHKPDYVFLGSTRSGGIGVNQESPGEFFYHNMQTQCNVIEVARQQGVKKLLFLAGSCVYPKECPQPIGPEHFLIAPMESTSIGYSTAKASGIVMCRAYRDQYSFNAIVAISATLYGPGSDTDLEKAHVMGALIARFDKAKEEKQKQVDVWGTGSACREFLYIEDFVKACEFLMSQYDGGELVHLGCGEDISIKNLAETIKDIVGFEGGINFDSTKPDGTLKKLLDVSFIHQLGWKAEVNLRDGISRTYEWYKGVKV